MAKLSINMDDKDMQEMRKRAEELRIPPTVYARMLIIQSMKAEDRTE